MRRQHENRFFYPVVGLAVLLVVIVLYFAGRQLLNSSSVSPVHPAPEPEVQYAPPDGVVPTSLPKLTRARKREEVIKHRKTSVPPAP